MVCFPWTVLNESAYSQLGLSDPLYELTGPPPLVEPASPEADIRPRLLQSGPKVVKTPVRPSALTTEAGTGAEPSGAWARNLPKRKLFTLCGPEANGMTKHPAVFGLEILLDTIVDGEGVVQIAVHVFGVSVAAEQLSRILPRSLISPVGLLVHGQWTGNIRDEVDDALGCVAGNSRCSPEFIGNRHQPYPSRLSSRRNLGSPVIQPGCRVRRQAIVACVQHCRAGGGSIGRQRTAREAGSRPDRSSAKNRPPIPPGWVLIVCTLWPLFMRQPS